MAASGVSTTSSTAGTGVGGSVIDVQSLVGQLVSAERAPFDQRITSETGTVTTQISALGTLKGALSDFQTTLHKLKTSDATTARSATTSDDAGFSATASSHAAPGSYSIEITKLAQAQQIASAPFADGP